MGVRDLFKTYREAKKLQRGELETTGPEFEPVQGVDVDRYAQICARIVKANEGDKLSEGELLEIVKSEGVDPAQWEQIANTWNDRVMNNMAV